MSGIQPSFSYTPPPLEELVKLPQETVRKVASNIARRHGIFLANAPDHIKALHSLHDHEYGVSVAAIKRSTTLGRLRRLRSQQFWLSSLNRILDAARESQARRAGLLGCVDQGKMPYCSNATIEILKAREQEIIRRVAQSPRKNLAEIYKNSEKSTFNKAYLQAKAMDIVANKRGMNWLFVTLTCPPEFHCNALSFDGSSFDDCQRYLKKVFAQIGRAIANAGYRSGTDYHGTRVLELHKDGTPHWHVLYYYTGDLDKVVEKKLSAIYSRECHRPKNYLIDNHDGIFLRAKTEVEESFANVTTPAISYLFKKLSHAFRLPTHGQSEDAIRHRYAIKAARARQIQSFGVPGHTTKIKALRKAYENEGLPESFRELTAPMKMAMGDPKRNEAQLQAMVGVLEGSLDHLQLLSTDTLNKFGEIVPRVTHIQSKVSQEIICISEMANWGPDQHKSEKGGVSINDLSFSCGCVKCDQMLAAIDLAKVPIKAAGQHAEVSKPSEFSTSSSQRPLSDDGVYLPQCQQGNDFCEEAFGQPSQSTKVKPQGLFASFLSAGRVHLRALAICISLVLILYALQIMEQTATLNGQGPVQSARRPGFCGRRTVDLERSYPCTTRTLATITEGCWDALPSSPSRAGRVPPGGRAEPYGFAAACDFPA